MGRLNGKVSIVTGASTGIGKEIALAFAKEGAKVVSASSSDRSKATADQIGDAAIAVRADVSVAHDVIRMVDAAESTWGRLDVLVNNAGYAGMHHTPLTEHSEENFDRTVAINLKGAFLGMKYGIAAMLRSGGGSVINVASSAGMIGWQGNTSYGAAKAGVIHMTKTAALDFARAGVRVNVIAPGATWTPMVSNYTGDDAPPPDFRQSRQPNGRWGMPGEIAAVAVFLASDESSLVSGAAIPVDGAWVAGQFGDARNEVWIEAMVAGLAVR